MPRPASRPMRLSANLGGIVVFLLCVFPVYWMVNTSLLPRREIRSPDPTWLPFGGTLDNYRRVFTGGQFFDALGMSLAVTLATVVVALSFAFLAAVAVSRFRFRGRWSFVVALLLIQMIPVEALFISQYKMLEGMHLLNTVAGLTLVYVASVLPFTIWTLRGFVAGVPYELEEAAMIDGCSRFQAFLRVTFPLLAPGLVATGVFGFIQAWNEFTLAVVVDDPRREEDAAGLAEHVHRRQPRHRLGRGDGRLDPDRDPGRGLLPRRPGPDGQRPHRRGGEGMSGDLDRLALRVQLSAFPGTTLPADVAGLLADGLGGLCLFGSNTADGPAALRALTHTIRDAGPRAVIAIDEEGGDVTRVHARHGSPVLGAAALGAADDLVPDPRDGERGRRRAGRPRHHAGPRPGRGRQHATPPTR